MVAVELTIVLLRVESVCVEVPSEDVLRGQLGRVGVLHKSVVEQGVVVALQSCVVRVHQLRSRKRAAASALGRQTISTSCCVAGRA